MSNESLTTYALSLRYEGGEDVEIWEETSVNYTPNRAPPGGAGHLPE